MKKLKKSDKKMILGVCSGIAEYFNIDATLIRLVFIILLIATKFFPLAIIYVVAAIIMPDSDAFDINDSDFKDAKTENETFEETSAENSNGTKKKSTAKIAKNKKSGEAQQEPHRSDEDFNSYFEK